MKQFNDDNFLLQTETAQRLYHDHAAKMPIIDYHCHLIPEYVASDHRFDNLSKIWLEGDHYKWRAMRTNGVDEKYCTGKDTTDWEKFEKWAETVPYTMRNPLYHWTHLELKTAFGVTKLLNPASAREIYDHCTALLQRPEYHARGLMRATTSRRSARRTIPWIRSNTTSRSARTVLRPGCSPRGVPTRRWPWRFRPISALIWRSFRRFRASRSRSSPI